MHSASGKVGRSWAELTRNVTVGIVGISNYAVAGSPWKASQDCRNSSRSWLMRPAESPNLRPPRWSPHLGLAFWRFSSYGPPTT